MPGLIVASKLNSYHINTSDKLIPTYSPPADQILGNYFTSWHVQFPVCIISCREVQFPVCIVFCHEVQFPVCMSWHAVPCMHLSWHVQFPVDWCVQWVDFKWKSAQRVFYILNASAMELQNPDITLLRWTEGCWLSGRPPLRCAMELWTFNVWRNRHGTRELSVSLKSFPDTCLGAANEKGDHPQQGTTRYSYSNYSVLRHSLVLKGPSTAMTAPLLLYDVRELE